MMSFGYTYMFLYFTILFSFFERRFCVQLCLNVSLFERRLNNIIDDSFSHYLWHPFDYFFSGFFHFNSFYKVGEEIFMQKLLDNNRRKKVHDFIIPLSEILQQPGLMMNELQFRPTKQIISNINQGVPNQSQDKTSDPNYSSTSSHPNFLNHQSSNFTQGRGLRDFSNPHRRTQIILAIALTALTTLWVQISVQRHGPFVRTAQCFFNEILFEHDSQDIYEDPGVIYWRNGETYDFSEMKGIFQRLNETIVNLETNSLFKIANYSDLFSPKYDIQMTTIYRYDIPQKYHVIDTFNFTIEEMGSVFQTTLLNRSFYEHLWKISLSIVVPIQYRSDVILMRLYLTIQIYSSMLLDYKLDVDMLNEQLQDFQNQNPFSSTNLGTRKLNDPHDLELDTPYISWLTLLIYMVLFVFQYKFIIQKNRYVNEKIAIKLKEEDKIQKLLKKIDETEKPLPKEPIISFGIQLMEVPQSEPKVKLLQEIQQSKQPFKLPIGVKMEKIGYYYILELVISFAAFFGYFNGHNGVICFLSWCKIIVYLAQTKNRLMFGFLFEETIPTYLRIQLNIILFITAFVLFNMLYLNTSKKFENLELGYYQYFFNYFQYGIYQNWTMVFTPFGMLAQFFYFIQIMLLLYIGNNILISVLANQVSKNSYLTSVEDMIDELQMQCPNCGTDFQSKKKGRQEEKRKEVLVSKIIKDLEFQRVRMSRDSSNLDSEYNIMIRSPNLSPYFPKKNQKQKNNEEFLSPNLKNKNLKDRLKQIDKKMQQQSQLKTTSKIEAFEQLKTKVGTKKIHIELSDSTLELKRKDKFHKEIRTKLELLFKKIEDFREISKGTPKRGPLSSKEREKEAKKQILNLIEDRIKRFQQQIPLKRS